MLSDNKPKPKGNGKKRTILPEWLSNLFRIPGTREDDIVSENSKIVLYGLFALLAFSILMYAITITQNVKGADIEKFNTVYIAVISGSLALGGTLIAQVWGKNNQ